MLYAFVKEPDKKEKQMSFIGNDDFESFTRKFIGKDTGVIVPNEHIEIIFDKVASADSSQRPNLFAELTDGTVLCLRGNVIVTCIGMKDDAYITDEAFKAEYAKLQARQTELFEKWFMV